VVFASRRTYADARSWTKSTRPSGFSRVGFAIKSFGAFFLAGTVGFGLFSMASPESFGQRGARVLNLGWPSAVLVGMILVAAGVLIAHRNGLSRLAGRNLTRPYSLGAGEDRAYEAAMNAVSACPRILQVRYALAWSWGPAVAACAGAILAISAAYYAVYAILAGGQVGAEIVLFALGNIVVGFGVFLITASRLVTWRFATSVYRTVSPGYLG
jgi:hypothetical protein